MRYSIGLEWVLSQGFLYVLGAVIYAVCSLSFLNSDVRAADLIKYVRHVCQRGSSLGNMISGVRTFQIYVFLCLSPEIKSRENWREQDEIFDLVPYLLFLA